MKKTFYMIVIFVLCSQFAIAGNYTDPNDPNGIVADPNDPNNVTVAHPVLLPGEEDIAAASSESMSLYAATELPELKYRLLPVKSELTDGDAAKLYFKAITAMSDPNQYDTGEVEEWIKASDGQIEKVKSLLELITGASKCRKCRWDQLENVESFELFAGLKRLTQILAIKARSEIAAGKYTAAVETIRSGIAMGRHIADSDSMMQGVLGVATASVMLKQVELLVQSPGSPSMFRSLQDMPRPLIRLEKVMDREWDRLKPKRPKRRSRYRRYYYEEDEQEAVPSKSEILSYSGGQITLLMKKLDRFVAALQCLEGVRFYAAKYGRIPKSLSDIDEFQLPDDPVTGRSFIYSYADGKAVLKSSLTEKQARQTSTIHYEFTLKE